MDLTPHIGEIARRLLNAPNRRLSSTTQLRFGRNGSVAVEIAGEKAGTWYDHESKTGGGALELIEAELGLIDSEATDWLRREIGIGDRPAPTFPRGQYIVATYGYRDEADALLFEVLRYGPEKTFRQRRPDNKGGWSWSTRGARLVPYRLPELLAAIKVGETTYIAEGEKAVERLRDEGLAATCSAGGAGKWRDEFSEHFTGANVVVLPDNDTAGAAHADQVARSLISVARQVSILNLAKYEPRLPLKGDAFDWFELGRTAEDIGWLVEGIDPIAGVSKSDADQKPTLALINPVSLAGLRVPERQWLVPDWVPIGRATGMYGAGGSGKTLLAQQLSTSCAIGGPWLGLTVTRCRSLLVFCEDDLPEMHRRQADINACYECSFADLEPIRWLPRLGDDNMLMTFADRPRATAFLDQILGAARDHDARLIVLDTLADVFGGNENDRAEARAFAQSALGYLAREIRGAVLTLAHPSRSGINSGTGESGSTAWEGTFRARFYLSTPDFEASEPADVDRRVLTRKKSNAARRDETIELRWRDGVFHAVTAASGIIASIERRTCERVFLDLLDRTTIEGQWVSHNPRSGTYAPRIFAKRPDREKFKQADFDRAMQALFASDEIVVGSYKGVNRHEHECIMRRADKAALGALGHE